MQSERTITAYCRLAENTLSVNGDIRFQQTGGTVSEWLDAVYQHLQPAYSKFHKMDHLSKLGWLASELLLKERPVTQRYPLDQVGIVLSNASASLDTDRKYFNSIPGGASPSLFVYTLPNIVIGEIAIRHKLTGENAFFVFKAFDATFMEQYISGLFDQGLVQACVGGWLELMEESYHAFLFLVEKNTPDTGRPFTKEQLISLYTSDHGQTH